MLEEIRDTIVANATALSMLELTAVISATLYVILAARRNIICFVFGFISSAIYTYLCYEIGYYQDMIIQSYYVIMSVVGWILWRKNTVNAVQIIPVRVTLKNFLLYITLGILGTLVSGYLFSTYTGNSLPYADAFTTAFAFVATWMGARRHPEHWLIFVVVDAVAVYMYFIKDMHLTAALNVLYVIIATAAYFSWIRKIRMASAK